jgi:hypothetical protein
MRERALVPAFQASNTTIIVWTSTLEPIMTTRLRLLSPFNSRTFIVCCFLACSLFASADVKTTSKMTISTPFGGQAPQAQTITTYYRKGVMRVESSEGNVFIMDSKTKKSMSLDKKNKTYSEFNLDSAMPADAAGMMKGMKGKMSGRLKPTSTKKSIAGKSSQQYLLTMVVDVTMPPMGEGQPSMGTMHGDVKGSFWTTTALRDKVDGSQMMGAYTEMFKGLSAFGDTRQVMNEFRKFKGFPLNSEMTMVMTMKPPKGSPAPPSGTPMTFTIAMKNQVQSISEAPLDANLFKIPKDYKKTDKPNLRGVGRG